MKKININQFSIVDLLLFVTIFFGALAGLRLYENKVLYFIPEKTSGNEFSCFYPFVIDGDTFSCFGRRVRLSNIDAPELPGHCRLGRQCASGDGYASKRYLTKLISGTIKCTPNGKDVYGRTLADCENDGKNISCQMVSSGFAIQRYGSLNCKN